MTSTNGSIWEKAVVLSLTLRKPGSTRKGDPKEVTVDCDEDRYRLSKKLLNSSEYKAIGTLDRKLKASLRDKAAPSVLLRDGMYPISLDYVEAVDAELESFITERQQRVDAFLAVYDQEKQAAQDEMRDLFKEDEFPTLAKLAAGFGVEHQWVTFSTPATFEKLGEAFFEKAKAKAEQQWSTATGKIEAAMAESMQGLVSHLAEQLTTGEDGAKKILHKSSVEKLSKFLDTFRTRNITDDGELLAIVEQAEKIIGDVDVRDVRKDEALRGAISKDMEQIKTALDGMVETRRRAFKFD